MEFSVLSWSRGHGLKLSLFGWNVLMRSPSMLIGLELKIKVFTKEGPVWQRIDFSTGLLLQVSCFIALTPNCIVQVLVESPRVAMTYIHVYTKRCRATYPWLFTPRTLTPHQSSPGHSPCPPVLFTPMPPALVFCVGVADLHWSFKCHY